MIGEVDRETAPVIVHEGAVYMHEGVQYVIDRLEWEQGYAVAREAAVDYYTDASTSTKIDVEETFETAVVGDAVKAAGRVLVTSQAKGFRVVKRYTHETLGFGRIELPAQHFETTAMWFYLTPARPHHPAGGCAHPAAPQRLRPELGRPAGCRARA